MRILEFIKVIIEIITSFGTVCVVIVHIYEKKSVQKFLKKTLPLFFCGTTTVENKKIKGFKALKNNREQFERTQNIIKAIDSEDKDEDVLVLNKEELFRILQESSVFTKYKIRK